MQAQIPPREQAKGAGRLILTINSGSSSLKFSLYRLGPGEDLVLAGQLDRIGVRGGHFQAREARGRVLIDRKLELPDHRAALAALVDWLKGQEPGQSVQAVGHRLVHGGPAYLKPVIITPPVLNDLRQLIPLAPDHLPHEIQAIETLSQIFSRLPQIACFDTAFHRQMPEVAQRVALPREYAEKGIMRYGFHGLSYEYLLMELAKEAGAAAARGRVIMAHLGNGASLAALKDGVSRETTMGMTPTGGLVMSTRSGDLDPGVVLYLLQEQGLKPDEVSYLLNHRAGLLGVSGLSSDMRDLLSAEGRHPQAAAAVALFCYQAQKFLGALVAVLGGLDTLVFSGGIGENSSVIRRRLLENLQVFGITLDPALNEAHAPIISRAESPVTVRVMKTNEELMIARHTHHILEAVSKG
jgi:acetate kinase